MSRRLFFFMVLFCVCIDLAGAEVFWQDISGGNTNVSAILMSSDKHPSIYIGTESGVFVSSDRGLSWRNIFLTKGGNKKVNYLSLDKDNNALYAATGNGLFFSNNFGQSWKKIFKGKNYLESDCMAILVQTKVIYLGTRGGLFISQDNGRSWSREIGALGKSEIYVLENDANNIYLACRDGLFKFEKASSDWQKIFITDIPANEEQVEENSDGEEKEEFFKINRMAICENTLFLATTRGIYKSQDQGKSWEIFSDMGLLRNEVKFLLCAGAQNFYAATEGAIFKYKADSWEDISLGLAATKINYLGLDNQDNLFAACDRGLFMASIKYLEYSNDGDFLSIYYKDEPKIAEIQQVAVNYAEVNPEKILEWRKKAAKKAIFPKVSASVNRDTADLWHWESGSSTRSYDDVLMPGNDSIGWDVTFTWDLAEVIWNSEQTSIDARSRLMVELRDNILDEVTKLYFERLRVKMEIDNLGIEDRKKRFEKELRLQELTASIDALTGGYFSSYLNRAK